MDREFNLIKFERYADDIICHCSSKRQVIFFKDKLEIRFNEVGLKMHPIKTKIAYCKDSYRRESHSCVSFDFLGFTFKPRKFISRFTKEPFMLFMPAISLVSAKKIREVIKSWSLKSRISYDFSSLSKDLNPLILGWINYYGKFGKRILSDVWRYLQDNLISWVRRKYKNYRSSYGKAYVFLRIVKKSKPNLFAHWSF